MKKRTFKEIEADMRQCFEDRKARRISVDEAVDRILELLIEGIDRD